MTEDADPRLALLLALADDELIIGHRHAEWTGWAPHIEEDLAFSSIAQDELAHARLLYGLAGTMTGQGEDELAFGRAPAEYRNAVLCERPNGDWGYSIARQYLYDTADAARLAALAHSAWKELGDIVGVIRLEERYHLEHARVWFQRMAGGASATARDRLATGLTATIGEAMAVFEPIQGEEELVRDGVLRRPSAELLSGWIAEIGAELEAVSLDFVLERHASVGEMVPTGSGQIEGETALAPPGIAHRGGRWVHDGGFVGMGGRGGRHSEDFEPLWEEMTGLYRAHPGARW
jgi:ring-1,2-phenylacetyl-CoA epoxidase subunit PaaC